MLKTQAIWDMTMCHWASSSQCFSDCGAGIFGVKQPKKNEDPKNKGTTVLWNVRNNSSKAMSYPTILESWTIKIMNSYALNTRNEWHGLTMGKCAHLPIHMILTESAKHILIECYTVFGQTNFTLFCICAT